MGTEQRIGDINATLCVSRPSSHQDTNVPVLVIQSIPSVIPPHHVLIRVDKFGFSANNITYQVLGEHPHFLYFDFHSAPESANGQISSKTHGLIPVWGFGTVVVSTHPKIKEGERVYGYFATTRYLLLPVSGVNKFSFYVPRPHLPADRRPYNQVIRCEADSAYTPTSHAEDLTMLYRPLFWTSYWCDDWLHSSGYRGGVSTILISSASAKTAFCLAYLIRKRLKRGEINEGTKVIGLTSKRNVPFTKQLGLYHEILEYAEFTSTPSLQTSSQDKWLYVDVAGNNDLNNRITAHFGLSYTPKLVAWVSLGLSSLSPSSKEFNSKSWSKKNFEMQTNFATQDGTYRSLPEVERFFMPEWLDIRRFQIPPQEIVRRQDVAWKELMEDCVGWVELERVYGPAAVKGTYEKVVKEGLGPGKGYVWSLWEEDQPKSHLLSARL